MTVACGSARAAKSAGRQTTLRPDWEQVKHQVMLCGLRGKSAFGALPSAAAAHPSTPARRRRSTDFVWGCHDPNAATAARTSSASTHAGSRRAHRRPARPAHRAELPAHPRAALTRPDAPSDPPEQPRPPASSTALGGRPSDRKHHVSVKPSDRNPRALFRPAWLSSTPGIPGAREGTAATSATHESVSSAPDAAAPERERRNRRWLSRKAGLSGGLRTMGECPRTSCRVIVSRSC